MGTILRRLTANYTEDEYNEYLEEPPVEVESRTVKAPNFDQLLKDAINELCLKCGKYDGEYFGACDGCKWLEYKYE